MSTQAILAAAKANLEGDLAVQAISSTVERARLDAISEKKLPVISVYDGGETVEELLADSPRVELRQLRLKVGVRVKDVAGLALEDAALQAAEVLRASVMANETFGGLARETFFRSRGQMTPGVTGSVAFGEVVLDFDVEFEFETFALVATDDLTSIDSGIDSDDDGLAEVDIENT